MKLFTLLLAAATSVAVVPPYSPVTNQVCSAGASSNIMYTLPRIDANGKAISSDLGTYSIVNCTAKVASKSFDCKFNNPFEGGNIQAKLRDGSADGTIGQYVFGPVAYAVVAIIVALAAIVWVTLFIIGRYFCCCCSRANCCCVTIQCGGYEPTPSMCCCGAREKKQDATAETQAEGKDAPHKEYAYPLHSRVAVYVLMGVFLALVTSFTLVGVFLGFNDIPEAAKEVAPRATNALMPLINNGLSAVQTLTMSMATAVVAPTLLRLNTTFQSAIDLNVVNGSLACIVTSIDTLPDTQVLISQADAFNASLVGVKASLAGLTNSINGVVASKDQLASAVTDLSGSVTTLNTTLAGVRSAILTVNSSVTPLLDVQWKLLNNSGNPAATGTGTIGFLPALQRDLGLLVPGGTGSGMPTASLITNTTGPADVSQNGAQYSGSMNRLIGGQMNQQPAEIGVLIGRLTSINASITGVLVPVNFTATATAITALNALASTTRTVTIPALQASINAAQAQLALLPTSATIQPLVDRIVNVTNNIPFSGIVGNLQSMKVALDALPSIPALITLLDSVRSVAGIIPCATRLTDQLKGVNATLVTLPAAVSDALGAINSVNDTLASALAKVSDLQTQLNNSQAQINGVNISSYVDQANGAWGSVNSSINAFNVTSIRDRIAQLDVGVPVNFTSLLASLSSLNDTLASATINASIADTLKTFDNEKGQLSVNITTAINDYKRLQKGMCSNSPVTPCTVATQAADCGGANTCLQEGLYRCETPNPNPTPCATDSQCGVGEGRCLADVPRAAGLKTGLEALRDNAPDVSGPLNQLSSTGSSAGAVDGKGIQASIQSALGAMGSIDTNSIAGQLTTVNASLNGFDTGSISSRVTSLNADVSNVDLSSFRPQINSLNSTVMDVKVTQRQRVVSIQALVGALKDLLNNRLKGYTTNQLTTAALTAAIAANGTSGLFISLAWVAQDAYNSLTSVRQDLFTLPAIDILGAIPSGDIDKYTGDGRTSTASRSYGLFNYAMGIIAPDKVVRPATTPFASGGSVFKDANGNNYANDRLCVTDACIAKTIDSYVSDNTLRQSTNGAIPLDIHPLGIVNLLWIFPGIVVILGVWAMLAPCGLCCCRKAPQWQKVPSACMTTCVMLQLPWCFFLAAMLFPAAMVTSDICASGRNVGFRVLLDVGDNLCPLASGTGGLTACSYASSIDLPSGRSLSLSTAVDFTAYYSALMGNKGASTCTGGVSPWLPVVTDLANQIRTIPYTEARYYIDGPSSMLSSAGLTLRPALADVIYSATNSTGTVVSNWLSRQVSADGVASCGALNGAINDSLDTVCCTLVRPIYWLSTVFFLLAWFYCCCGLPAGIWGRKRLVTGVWGTLAGDNNKTGAAKPGDAAAAAAAAGSSTEGAITGAPAPEGGARTFGGGNALLSPAKGGVAGASGSNEDPAVQGTSTMAVVGPDGTLHPNVTVRPHHSIAAGPARAVGSDPSFYYDQAINGGQGTGPVRRTGTLAGAVPVPISTAPGAHIELTAVPSTVAAGQPQPNGMLPVVPHGGPTHVIGRPSFSGASFGPTGVGHAGGAGVIPVPRTTAAYAIPIPPQLNAHQASLAAAAGHRYVPSNGQVPGGAAPVVPGAQYYVPAPGSQVPVDIDGARFK